MKRRNAKNHKRDFVKHFHSGERADFVNSLPCIARTFCHLIKVQNHHVISRGAGGTYRDIVPLCDWHHDRLHRVGRVTFEKHYGVNLKLAAFETEQSWLQHKAGA